MNAGTDGGRAWRLVALMLAVSFVVAACGGEGSPSTTNAALTTTVPDDGSTSVVPTDGLTDEEVAETVLRIGIVDAIPYSYIDPQTNKAAGICPEIIDAALEARGFPPAEYLSVTAYADVISGLQAERWDMIGACLQITPERCETILFTEPLEQEIWTFAVPPGNPKNLTALADFVANEELLLGAPRGNVGVTQAINAGVPEDRIVLFNNYRDGLDGVLADRVDAAYGGRLGFVGIEISGLDVINVVDAPRNPAGGGFRHEDTDLAEAFNEGLELIKADGTFARITLEYGLDPETSTEKTMEQACNPS